MERELLIYYLNELDIKNMPEFLMKYLSVPSLTRLLNIGYFCGMDYASKDIYDFKEKITRFDHSISTSLLTWKLTKDKTQTISALFHDVATPCFSHVIDYMNKDYEKQESTEEYTEKILKSDSVLIDLLKEDDIDIDNIWNFKKYPIVDNERPKICVDRLDGIILNSISWTQSINKNDIKDIVEHTKNINNEIVFDNEKTINKLIELNEQIDLECHSNYDNYMMELLASITKESIDTKLITYEDIYILDEMKLFEILKMYGNKKIQQLLEVFETIKKDDISNIEIVNVKKRTIKPKLINNK